MQAEQKHYISWRRRRRSHPGCCSRLLLPTLAAVSLLYVTSSQCANAFVPPSFTSHQRSRQSLRHKLGEALPHKRPPAGSTLAAGGSINQPIVTMVPGESPSAACRRALQRAWRASSPQATTHESESEDDLRSERMELDGEGDSLMGLDLRLTTFNLLAPCYKRMHGEVVPLKSAAALANAGTGLLANQAKRRHTARESEFAGLWTERATETVEFIKREMSSSDIICLQEFWFDPAYETIFRSALGDSYDFHTVKRTGGKSDGVAVLLRKGKWDVRSKLGLSLSAIGDRVALVMHLRSKDSEEGKAPGGEDLILVNTHLAFPHNSLDRMNQMAQIEVITETVETVVREAGLPTMTPRVVVGDLNVEGTDPVCGHLGANGFRSAFASLHLEQRVITHRNHKGEEVMVDHVFVKAPGFAGRKRGEAAQGTSEVPGLVARLHEDVLVEEAMLLPGGVDTAAWSPRFRLSDHRPLTVRLKFPAD